MAAIQVPANEPNEEAKAFRFQPCIAEMMRTGYNPPSIVLLVQRIQIERAKPPHDDLEAFRLFVSDGAYTMQAVLKSETHRFVITGETTEGSYIMLDKYTVKKAPRSRGEGEIVYLAIANFHTVGHCDEYPRRPIFDRTDTHAE